MHERAKITAVHLGAGPGLIGPAAEACVMTPGMPSIDSWRTTRAASSANT